MPHKDPLARKEYLERWNAANSEKVVESKRKWQAANQGQVKTYRATKKYRDEQAARIAVWRLNMTPEQVQADIFRRARKNAKRRGLEFTLTPADVAWPAFCPVLGIRLDYTPRQDDEKHATRPNCPSIDRTDSSRGYVPGNIAVMSWRANRLKHDATAEEIELLAGYMRLLGEKNG